MASQYATEIFWTYNGPEAVGTVQIIRSNYGAYINYPDLYGKANAVALADLFYRSEEGQGIRRDKPYTFKVWDAGDLDGDPVHEVEYYELH